MFLPYLWGIETYFAGAFVGVSSSFLPYLWGIETEYAQEKKDSELESFYPTYEALKQSGFIEREWWIIGFYPTYEALKLSSPNIA